MEKKSNLSWLMEIQNVHGAERLLFTGAKTFEFAGIMDNMTTYIYWVSNFVFYGGNAR